MDPAQWRKIEAIYHEASRIPPEERNRFLDERCVGDDVLKEEVFSLLEAKAAVGDFMVASPLSETMQVETATAIIKREELAWLGKTIGAYRFKSVIASGGMGTVYLAERIDEAFRQKVAIKVILGGLKSREILRRFYRERQILADLNHLNIARLLDGGSTEDGNPYLVMEYIKGASIDTYCDDRKLTVSERLMLFQKVCAAVQYAHGKLVVHRDIKPRNILVTGEGEPKLLDFGIVKLLDPGKEMADTLTLTVQRLMTPEYASPEQIRGENISTATDIYSLGIVLYELLTGHRPFRFQTTSAKEVERIVCEEEPLKPSTAVNQTTVVSLPGVERKTLTPEIVSRTREGKPERLRKRLRGDLDYVVMKALRKEPELRYASAEHFSEDIRRHLSGLPVYARRGTLRYRAQKFVKRNKTAMLLAFVLLILLTVPAYMWIQNARQATHKKTADQVLLVLKDLYNKPFSNKTPRDEIRLALEDAQTRLPIDNLKDQPEELIRFADTITQICESFHLYDHAVEWREISHACHERMFRSGIAGLANSCFLFGKTLLKAGRYEEAWEQIRKADDLIERFPQEHDVPPGALDHLLADTQWNLGRLEEARASFERSLQSIRSRSGGDPELLIEVLTNYANFLAEYGDSDDALTLLEQALGACASIPGDRRALGIASVHQNLGKLLWFTPRFKDAELYLRSAYESFHELLPETDPRLIACTADLAALLQKTWKPGEGSTSTAIAYDYWLKSRKWQEEVYGADSLEAARMLSMIAATVTDGTARSILKGVWKEYRKYWPENHPRMAVLAGRLGSSISCVQQPMVGNIDLGQGEDLIRKAIRDLSDQVSPNQWMIGQFKLNLAINLLKQEKLDEVPNLISEGLSLWRRTLGDRHPHYGKTLTWISRVYDRLGMVDEALKYKLLSQEKISRWPYYEAIRDCDLSREGEARIDFEDDQIEKILVIDAEPERFDGARLWIYGRPHNYPWQNFRDYENIRIQVNSGYEISFNVAMKFGGIMNTFQWIPFEIPVDWLVQGPNRFTIYIAHEDGYEDNRPWEYNNLFIGIDMDHDHDRSWWFGGLSDESCCVEMALAAIEADKPLPRDASIIEEHREKGYRECNGELMILLELL